MRKPFVAGNWKMNGSRASINTLVSGILEGMGRVNNAEVVVCPSFVYISEVANMLEGSAVNYGSQDVAKEESGAYTGEISVSMLKDMACKYAIVGHSERRALYGDTDKIVAEKFVAAQNGSVTPILCVGEVLEERESGQTEAVVERQLQAIIDLTGINALENSVIAYEPVWAIGTGKTASPEQAQAVHAFIRQWMSKEDAAVAEKVQILYGGSVKAANAKELFSQADIDGGLIGGASLAAEEFISICEAAG